MRRIERLEGRLCLSTVTFETHNIECCSAQRASIVAADVDGDGDADVVSTLPGENSVVWYENTSGTGSFSPKKLIHNTESRPFARNSAIAADVDGDGDTDVLSASYGNDGTHRLAWYENVDGLGKFGSRKDITEGPNTIAIADIDSDGDNDILVTMIDHDRIAWLENEDGTGSFASPTTIADPPIPVSVLATDIDGDGDTHVFAASSGDDTISWYENTDGHGVFDVPRPIATDESNGIAMIIAADMDDDEDMDVISASSRLDVIAWYENTDGFGRFGQRRVIASNLSGVLSLVAADVNGDGKVDVLSASFLDGRLAWHEQRVIGDVNTDGRFSSADLVGVFQSGTYEDNIGERCIRDVLLPVICWLVI